MVDPASGILGEFNSANIFDATHQFITFTQHVHIPPASVFRVLKEFSRTLVANDPVFQLTGSDLLLLLIKTLPMACWKFSDPIF